MASAPFNPSSQPPFKPGFNKPGPAPALGPKFGYVPSKPGVVPPGMTPPKPGFTPPSKFGPGASPPVAGPSGIGKPVPVAAEPVVPPKARLPPALTEAEANQLMDRVNAEVVARSSIDNELEQLTKEAEESVKVQFPEAIQAFQQACGAQIQQLSSYSQQVSTSLTEASALAKQARQAASQAPMHPAVSQPPLNTDQLSKELSDILSQAQTSLSDLCSAYQNAYSEDVAALADHANTLWAAFDGKYQTVKAKNEEMKVKYPQPS